MGGGSGGACRPAPHAAEVHGQHLMLRSRGEGQEVGTDAGLQVEEIKLRLHHNTDGAGRPPPDRGMIHAANVRIMAADVCCRRPAPALPTQDALQSWDRLAHHPPSSDPQLHAQAQAHSRTRPPGCRAARGCHSRGCSSPRTRSHEAHSPRQPSACTARRTGHDLRSGVDAAEAQPA